MADFNALALMYRLAYSGARGRAMRKGWPCLSPQEFVVVTRRAQDRCEVTGRTFDREPHEVPWRGRRPFKSYPWAPSLDRLDNMGGYEAANVRLVCVCVNAALGYWSDAVFAEMCRAFVTWQQTD
jgi:hypothetical protein